MMLTVASLIAPLLANAAFTTPIELSTLDSSNGFALNGVAAYDQSGYPVSGAGDINGDGIGDLIIGAYGADPNGTSSGQSYVVLVLRRAHRPHSISTCSQEGSIAIPASFQPDFPPPWILTAMTVTERSTIEVMVEGNGIPGYNLCRDQHG